MSDAEPPEEATLFPKSAGERLREVRESLGLSLDEIAARTRVPMRHLQAIEKSDYSSLPSATYAIGFAKAYARAIGLDEVAIGREVRGGMPDHAPAATYSAPSFAGSPLSAPAQPRRAPSYEAADPARLPPKGLTAALVAVAVVLIAGTLLWYSSGWFMGDGSTPAPAPATTGEPAAPVVASVPVPPPGVPTGGQVKLTATDAVWLKIYDTDGATLMMRELQPGESYDVPFDAKAPMINVGRPDKLVVTIDGQQVPPLGDGSRAIKDVGISAAALRARAAGDMGPTLTVPAEGEAKPQRAKPKQVPPSRDDRRASNETARANEAAAAAPTPVQPPPAQPAGDATPPQ